MTKQWWVFCGEEDKNAKREILQLREWAKNQPKGKRKMERKARENRRANPKKI